MVEYMWEKLDIYGFDRIAECKYTECCLGADAHRTGGFRELLPPRLETSCTWILNRLGSSVNP